jgi:hypothetical protein
MRKAKTLANVTAVRFSNALREDELILFLTLIYKINRGRLIAGEFNTDI